MRFSKLSTLYLGLWLAGACGGAQTEPVAPGAQPSDTSPAQATPAAVSWSAMDKPQRLEHMKKVVLPRMKAVFQEHDAEEFAGMDCKVCHGASAEKGEFHMPNPDLPQLNPTNQFAEHMDHEPEMMKFMRERVLPEMAKLLSMEPYDPGTNQGFGCFGCHTQGQGGSHKHHSDKHEHEQKH